MNSLNNIKRIYFLGIGGIGMSALARHFLHIGKRVGGYDRTRTPLTIRLESEGMDIHYVDDPGRIPAFIREQMTSRDTLYIYTPALASDHQELNYLKDLGVTLHKRAEVLGLLSRFYQTLAVAGSHGKSTISAMITQLFVESGLGCNAFLGAVSKNLNSNYIAFENSPWAVMEADEFDRSFLHLSPQQALVSSMDPDHLDIYSSLDDIKETFTRFINRVEVGSTVILKEGLEIHPDVTHRLLIETYSLENATSDYYVTHLEQEGMGYRFDLVTPSGRIEGMSTQVPGITNVENAVGASAMSLRAGLNSEDVKRGIAAFRGLSRRFDIHFNRSGVLYMDDYAHHPNEIRALIGSVKRLFPGKKVTGIFQPHLFTRTRDLAEEFGGALSMLDELILLDIYPARELPIAGVDAGIILKWVTGPEKGISRMEDLPDLLGNKKIEVLLTIGAGNIDQLVDPITKYLDQHVS